MLSNRSRADPAEKILLGKDGVREPEGLGQSALAGSAELGETAARRAFLMGRDLALWEAISNKEDPEAQKALDRAVQGLRRSLWDMLAERNGNYRLVRVGALLFAHDVDSGKERRIGTIGMDGTVTLQPSFSFSATVLYGKLEVDKTSTLVLIPNLRIDEK